MCLNNYGATQQQLVMNFFYHLCFIKQPKVAHQGKLNVVYFDQDLLKMLVKTYFFTVLQDHEMK